MKFHFSIEEAIKELANVAAPSVLLMQHGSLQLEYYSPKLIDKQTPHKQDEVYIIASGNALLYRDGEMVKCKEGDVLFVPAAVEHRFKNFSEDFATWVIFYGPEGGEMIK